MNLIDRIAELGWKEIPDNDYRPLCSTCRSLYPHDAKTSTHYRPSRLALGSFVHKCIDHVFEEAENLCNT